MNEFSSGSRVDNNLPERESFYRNHNFYILHGNFQRRIPEWAKQFGQFLEKNGVPENQIHAAHLRHLLAKYRSWRKDSSLPNLSEDMFSNLPEEASRDHHPIAPERDSKNAVIIGHSSGAQMAMIWAEHHQNAGLVLLSPTDSADAGNTGSLYGSAQSWLERASGMYTKTVKDKKGVINRIDREPNWGKIVKNSRFIVVVHPMGDEEIPAENSRNVYFKLKEASENLTASGSGEASAIVAYENILGNGHNPEPQQFAQIMSQIPL